jgi:hypothetical protein
MKPAPMLASVTARLCWISTSCSSALRRLRTSASSDPITDCSWLTDGIRSSFGISGHNANAVTMDTPAVKPLVSTCRP